MELSGKIIILAEVDSRQVPFFQPAQSMRSKTDLITHLDHNRFLSQRLVLQPTVHHLNAILQLRHLPVAAVPLLLQMPQR
jgi:hypothetical protein